MLKKIKKINFYRKPIQWLVVVSLGIMVFRSLFNKEYIADIEAYCPFGGIQSLGSFLIRGSLACSMTLTQIGMGLALFVAVIIFSKLFCSFICPLGIFSEWIGKYGEKFKLRYTFKGLPDRLLRVFKYALLFITLYYTVDSSELFCKKFDPYYAFFSGFDHEVNLTYAFIAIFILVAGSFFIRLAWCKYMCPLSALSNIFSYILLILPLIFLYIAIVYFSPLLFSWKLLFLIICISGFVFEFFKMKFFILPFFRITRNIQTCTSCRLCDKACPMGINVSESKTVKHIDCHLCTDCVNSCPEKNTLNINKSSKLKWIPAITVIVLFVAALVFSHKYEIPTISEFWGSKTEIENAEIFEIEGLKSIRCFGSSKSFALHLRGFNGVLGVETYVKNYKALIYYNPDLISHDDVGKLIFTPAENLIEAPINFQTNVAVWDVKIDKYFDEQDAYYMQSIMKQNKGIYAYKISYGEPAPAQFFFNPDLTNPELMRKAIEQKTIILYSESTPYEQKINFEVKDFNTNYTFIKAYEFYKLFLPELDYKFKRFNSLKNEDLEIAGVFIDEMPNQELNENLLLLMSHISADNSIVRFTTEYNENGILVKATFVKQETTPESVKNKLMSPQLFILYDDGFSETITNDIKYRPN